MKKFLLVGLALSVGVMLISTSGCITPTASEHAEQLGSTAEREMTVGIVQRDIEKGMSQAEVAEVLGSPNIVTKDTEGLETWIYDKIATEVSVSAAGRGIISIIIGEKITAAASQTQKTLTVIIKFKDGLVYDFSYHSSRF